MTANAQQSEPEQANPVTLYRPGDQPGEPSDAAGEVELFRHVKRPEWGLAIVVRERDGRYDVQFQDGELRTLAPEFLHLLSPVDRPADETSAALGALTRMSGMTLARNERDDEGTTRTITLDEQVDYFLDQYEEGFDDPQWIKRVRGSGAKRRAKGHREPAIAEARKLLAPEVLDELLAQVRADEILARAIDVMKATSLITQAQLRPYQELGPERHTLFGRALQDLLYGEQELELRFAKFVQVFRHTPTALSWPAATLWLALIEPDDHVCVRPNVFSEQARWMAPVLRLPTHPDGRIYLRLRDMSLAVRDELRKRGLGCRDLMDVYDFIWSTLRPAAQKAILARPPAPRASRVQLATEDDHDQESDDVAAA